MINEKQFQEKLRSEYFTLVSSISQYSYADFLSEAVTQLKEILPFTHASFYIYDDWNKMYKRTTTRKEESYIFKENADLHVDPNTMDGNEMFCHNDPGLETLIIPLHPTCTPNGFLLIGYEKEQNTLSDQLSLILKDETEKVLHYLNEYNENQIAAEKNKFLYDCSARFYAINKKKKILAEIIKVLQGLYPTFSYYLLLSQDYEADSELPIKAIEYSDDATKRVSKQAFLTGEVQLENRVTERNTYLYAPLKGKQGVYGVLQIIAPNAIDFPEKEIVFIMQFADTAGQAIENISLYQHSKHLVDDLKLINDATHQLNSNLKLSEITKLVSKQIMDTCGATEVGFIYFDETADENFDILSGSTFYFESQEGQLFAAMMMEQMKEQAEPIFSGDYKLDQNVFPYRSIMAIPMIHSEMIHGVITIMHEEAYFFSFERFKLMQSLIQHSTLALSNAILKDKLEKAVITDYLTGLYSRNYLDDSIKVHMEQDKQGTLILFDIDDFKKINDTYGHYIGDEVIVQAAEIIRTNLKEADIPARWGGEELAVYLPHATLADGERLAEEISKQVACLSEPSITFSSGVSSWTVKTTDSVSELFIRADKALYEAKESGKNRVVIEAYGENMSK